MRQANIRGIVLRNPTWRQCAGIGVLWARRGRRCRHWGCWWGTERVSPTWGRVRCFYVNVEPGLVAAKVGLLGMRGRFWWKCARCVIFLYPPIRKRPRVRVRRLTRFGRNVRGGRATMGPRRRRCSGRAEWVSPRGRWVRSGDIYIEPSFVAVNVTC